MMTKVFVGVILVVFLFAFSGAITNGIHDWRTDSITQTVSVTTGGGVTTANVTLNRELMNDAVTEITSMTSTISETPIAGTFTAPHTLLLTNLTASQTRDITLVYYSETEDTYLQIFGPFLTILIFGGILAAIIMGIFVGGKSGRGGRRR